MLMNVPELPEVEALAGFLRERLVGRAVDSVEIGAISALKTYDPQPAALSGLGVTAVHRHGKFIDLDVDGLHLIFHLARGGWLRWNDTAIKTMLKPGKSHWRCGCASPRTWTSRKTSPRRVST